MKFIIMAANGFEGSFELWLKKRGYSYSILNGMYKGVPEISFKIDMSHGLGFNTLRNRAGFYNQESILLIDNDNDAYLYFVKTSESQKLGKWQAVDRDTAVKSDAYSYDYSTDTYYLAA